MFIRECNQGRASEHVVEDTVFSVSNSALQQCVTYNTYVNTSFTSLFTESGHSANCHAAGISHNSRQGNFGSLVDFSDDGLLVFEFNCHGFNSCLLPFHPTEAGCRFGV